jgi:large subunit ribosomal protein L29
VRTEEVRERSTVDLRALEAELTRQLWQARIDNHTNQLDDTASVRRLRRDIARVHTILRERELTGAGPTPKKAETADSEAAETAEE